MNNIKKMNFPIDLKQNFFRSYCIFLLCSCFLIVSSIETYALPGKEHSQEITAFLGIDFSSIEGTNSLKIINWYVIDDHKIFRSQVLNNCKIFNRLIDNKEITFTRGYSHRILFHWGAGGSIPFNKSPLKDYFKSLAEAGIPKEEIDLFKQMIKNEWQRRRKIMFEAFESFLVKACGLSEIAAKTLSKPLSTLAFNIHLLGDYETTHIKGINNVERIRDDIVKVLENRVFRGDFNVTELINKLKTIDCTDAKLAADEIRSALKEMLPAAIESKLGKTLAKVIVKSAIVGSYLYRASATYSKITAKIKNQRVRSSINTGLFVGSISSVINAYAVLKGQTNVSDAIYKTIEDTGLSFASMYIAEGVVQSLKNNKYAITVLLNDKAAGAFFNYGVATFIFDESQSVWNFAKGQMSTDEFIEESSENLLKAVVTGTASYCAVILNAAPGGFVVVGVSIGSYILVTKAIYKYKEYSNSKYLFVEDIYPFLPLNIQRAQTIWNISSEKTIWDNAFTGNQKTLWEHEAKGYQNIWSSDTQTIWK